MNTSSNTLPQQSPVGRAVDAWRSWFRQRHSTRDRRVPWRADEARFAITEWADTEAGFTDADGLAPPNLD